MVSGWRRRRLGAVVNGGKAMKGVYEGYFESEQAISDSCFRMRVLRAILIVILLFPHMSSN